MQLKLTAVALAAALLLAGCGSAPKPVEPNIISYESTLDRVHARDTSAVEYYDTRAGGAIRQGEEYVQVLWNEHEAGETDPDKLAHYYGQETKQERLARLAKERQAKETALKAQQQKNAKAKSRHSKDRSIYGTDQSIYDQSIYLRPQPKAKSNSAAKRFVEKTTLRKKETMKQAVQNAPTVPLNEMPNQKNGVVPAKTAPALQTQAPVAAPTTAPVATPSVAPVKEAPKMEEAVKVAPKAEEAVKTEVKAAEVKAVEAVKTSEPVKAANDLAEKEKAKTDPVVTKHVIDPVIKNAQVNPTAQVKPSAPALPPEPTIAPRTVEGTGEGIAEGTDGMTPSVHPDGEPAPGAVPELKVGNPQPKE